MRGTCTDCYVNVDGRDETGDSPPASVAADPAGSTSSHGGRGQSAGQYVGKAVFLKGFISEAAFKDEDLKYAESVSPEKAKIVIRNIYVRLKGPTQTIADLEKSLREADPKYPTKLPQVAQSSINDY